MIDLDWFPFALRNTDWSEDASIWKTFDSPFVLKKRAVLLYVDIFVPTARWNHQKITDVLWYNHHYTLGRLCIIHKVEHISHGDKKMKTDVTVQSKPLWIWMCLHIGLYAYFPFHHNLANFTEIQSSDHQLSINTAKVSTQTSRYISFHLVPGWIDFFRRYVHEVRYISAPFRDSITSRDDGFCCCRHIQKQEWR